LFLVQKIAIVVPVFNESASLENLCERIKEVFAQLPSLSWEIIFINDGSTDQSWEKIFLLSQIFPGVRGIDLSRNFGKEVALSAGLHEAQEADAVICIDADLQHPPELIPMLVQEWHDGAEMVITVRSSSKNETLFRKISSDFYYWFINKISNVVITPKSTDFRLFDKKVVKEFIRMSEKNRMFRGIMDWMGFKRAYVEFIADSRAHGETTFSLYRLIQLAVTSIMSFSIWPLKLTGYLGLFITTLSFFGFLWMVVNSLISGGWHYTPLAMAVIANTFLIGIVLMAIGLVALYIGTIHIEVINRPLYLVREKTSS
jgi:polyisoprenyl-phosphate glycosyltransferase